jgi:hypothetical protein
MICAIASCSVVSQTPNLANTTPSHLSPSHQPATIATLPALLLALSIILASSLYLINIAIVPLPVLIRKLRSWTLPFTVVFVMYRFVTSQFFTPPSTDLLKSVLSTIEQIYDVLQHYASAHLSPKLASSTMSTLRDVAALALLRQLVVYYQTCRRSTLRKIKDDTIDSVFTMLKENVPLVQAELKKEQDKMESDLEADLKDSNRKRTLVLPKKGRASRSLITDLKKRGGAEDKKWQEGLVSGAVYNGDKSHTDLLNAAYAAFSLSNPLHPDIWPSINQFVSEFNPSPTLPSTQPI